jgi:hypothetical protein
LLASNLYLIFHLRRRNPNAMGLSTLGPATIALLPAGDLAGARKSAFRDINTWNKYSKAVVILPTEGGT